MSILDQNGTLISDFETAANGLDPSQLSHLRQIEAALTRRATAAANAKSPVPRPTSRRRTPRRRS
ncbi:MAG: hypothetical protein ABIR94_16905, partial [Rubrivivax sp.]